MTSMTTRLLRRLSPLLLVPAVLVSLAACSDDGDDGGGGGGGGDAAASDSPTSDATTPTTISPPDLPAEPTVEQSQGAADDVTWSQADCATAAGDQSTEGTVENPTRAPVDYAITVNWTNDTFDVLGRGVAVVRDVAPGKTVEWSVDAEVADGATQCVPKVERGTVVTRR